MLFKTFSAAVFGIDAYLVEVEVDIVPAYQGNFNVAGLPDIAVEESRERIKSALRNCGFDFPGNQAVTVNLAPADIRKEGSAFDLPMALGWVGCQGTFFGKILDTHVFLGELSLDGVFARCPALFQQRWQQESAASRKKPSRPRGFTASRECWTLRAAWLVPGPSARRTTPSVMQA